MKKILNKIYYLIDKIGKPNFILITFLIFVLSIFGLYQTFSIFTSSEGVSLIDGIKTLQFILNEDNEETSVTIAPGSSKNIAITVTNNEEINLKYGIYYSSTNDLTNVDLGYLYDSEYLPNGTIPPEENYIVTIKIDNDSENNVTITFGTIYGTETGGELELKSNQNFLDIKYLFSLNEVSPGSYVKYIGNNGCKGASCTGQNANYVSKNELGYCTSQWTVSNNYYFYYKTDGWRLAYIQDNYPHIISAGATDCIATDSNGNFSSTPTNTAETTAGLPVMLSNFNTNSLKYCNAGFSINNTCDNTTIWPMKESDFTTITDNNFTNCYNKTNDNTCGANNDLIYIDGYYWFGTLYSGNTNLYYSDPAKRIGATNSAQSLGMRPVMKLSSSVKVLSGTGTYKDPYIIDNPDTVRDLSGNMNNGVPKNGLSWDQENGSIRTDGAISFLHAGLKGYNFGSNVSFVIRIKFNELPSEVGEYKEFFGNWEGGGLGFGIAENNIPYFTAYLNAAYPRATTEQTLEKNKWYTLVGTYNGSELNLYIDGVKQTPTTASGNIGISNAPMVIGGNSTPATDDTVYTIPNADYSDALIFTRTLSDEEITNNYSGIPNPTNKENLLLYYDFKR